MRIIYLDQPFPTFLPRDGDSQNIKDNNNDTFGCQISRTMMMTTTIIYFEAPLILFKLHLVFWNFWIWATVVEISVKKQGLGTSWMGWGPVDWVGRVLPKPKFKKKCTSFFDIFGFERPLLRYLLKTVLHYKGSGIWLDAITQVTGLFESLSL